MATSEKKASQASIEVEHGVEKTPGAGFEKGTIQYERAQMLASLPDPDAGKTDEERLAIVRRPTFPLPPSHPR